MWTRILSDGMTEDITTSLSKVSQLLVIARNSAFTYKGKAVKVQQVGAELGVQYVVEGSIRRLAIGCGSPPSSSTRRPAVISGPIATIAT